MQAGRRRCGSLVHHSGTVSRWTTVEPRFQVSGPSRIRAGRVRRAETCRRARTGARASLRVCGKEYAGGSVTVRPGDGALVHHSWAKGSAGAFTPSSSRPETVAACTGQACRDTWAGPSSNLLDAGRPGVTLRLGVCSDAYVGGPALAVVAGRSCVTPAANNQGLKLCAQGS